LVPLPAVASVLTALRPLDLPALERGMQRFLEQLDRIGQRLTGPREAGGLYAWIAAGAAAVLACEMGRRQLRRPAEAAELEIPGLHGGSGDRLFVE
jgi:hypothetical protein